MQDTTFKISIIIMFTLLALFCVTIATHPIMATYTFIAFIIDVCVASILGCKVIHDNHNKGDRK